MTEKPLPTAEEYLKQNEETFPINFGDDSYKGFQYYDPETTAAAIKKYASLHTEQALREFAKRVKEKDAWIPVSERLPEIDTRVLVFTDDTITISVFTQDKRFLVEKNHSPGERSFVEYWINVTHWQPLPSKPQ